MYHFTVNLKIPLKRNPLLHTNVGDWFLPEDGPLVTETGRPHLCPIKRCVLTVF